MQKINKFGCVDDKSMDCFKEYFNGKRFREKNRSEFNIQ